jgi:hypothetical protein
LADAEAPTASTRSTKQARRAEKTLPPLRRAIRDDAIVSSFGENEELRGSVCLFLERLFSPPLSVCFEFRRVMGNGVSAPARVRMRREKKRGARNAARRSFSRRVASPAATDAAATPHREEARKLALAFSAVALSRELSVAAFFEELLSFTNLVELTEREKR